MSTVSPNMLRALITSGTVEKDEKGAQLAVMDVLPLTDTSQFDSGSGRTTDHVILAIMELAHDPHKSLESVEALEEAMDTLEKTLHETREERPDAYKHVLTQTRDDLRALNEALLERLPT